MRTFIVSIIVLFVFCFGVLPKAQAQNDATPVGKWTLIFYFEPGLQKGSVTFSMCFLSNGTWSAKSSPGQGVMNGDWFQKGDRIRLYGRIGTSSTFPIGFAAFGQFNSNLQFTGEFAQFSIGPSPVTRDLGNFIIFKVSDTC